MDQIPNSKSTSGNGAKPSTGIGAHNIASLRLASGRALPGSSSSSFSQSLGSGQIEYSTSPSTILRPLELRTTATRRRSPAPEVRLQFLMLGAPRTGKTSLLRRLQNLEPVPECGSVLDSTIGPDLHRLQCGQVEAIDIGGSDRCHPIAKSYADLFDAFVIVFELTNAESFLYAKYWLDYLEARQTNKKSHSLSRSNSRNEAENGPESPKTTLMPRPPPSILLIGNKRDRITEKSDRQVSRNLARSLAAAHGAQYLEISARQDLNLTEAIVKKLERLSQENSAISSS